MEDKRFKLEISPNTKIEQYCIIDTAQEVLTIYNDLGNIYFTSAPAICDLLNELNNEVEDLIQDNNRLRAVNKRLEDEHMKLNKQIQLLNEKISTINREE